MESAKQRTELINELIEKVRFEEFTSTLVWHYENKMVMNEFVFASLFVMLSDLQRRLANYINLRAKVIHPDGFCKFFTNKRDAELFIATEIYDKNLCKLDFELIVLEL